MAAGAHGKAESVDFATSPLSTPDAQSVRRSYAAPVAGPVPEHEKRAHHLFMHSAEALPQAQVNA